VLQVIASINPVSALIAAVRELFGNPVAPVTKHYWTLVHPVTAAWIACGVMLALAIPAALRRYRARTSD
jgi:ABC-2 type transport system permease protein